MYTITLIKGSMRKESYTGKALAFVTDEFMKNGIQTKVIDPEELNLAMPGLPVKGNGAFQLQKWIKESAGIILSTPEYHGAFSSVIKLVIENMGFPSAMAGKPVGLLGVATGQIGAVKSIEMLRGVCGHVGALVLPGSVSIANVNKVIDEKGNCLDLKTETRIRGLANNMINYINRHVCPGKAFEEVVRGT